MAFVYCPNAKCNAASNAPLGHSWRWINQGPSNCKRCHFAFLLGKQHQRGRPHDGGNIKTSDKGPAGRSYAQAAGKRVTWQDQTPTAATEGKEEQITRRLLTKTFKEQGLAPDDVKSKIDEIFPPKPLSDEEKRADVKERLEKAQRQHKHECTKHGDMHASAVKKARELLEYRNSIQAQLQKAQLAKEQVDRLQEEHDHVHAATVDAAPVQPALSVEGLITRAFAESKLLEKFDSNEAGRVKDLFIQLHQQLSQDTAATAGSPASAASTAAASPASAAASPASAAAAASGSAAPALTAIQSAAASVPSGSEAAAGVRSAAVSEEVFVPGAASQPQQPANALAALPPPPSLQSVPMDDARIKNSRLREDSAAPHSSISHTTRTEESENKRIMLPGDEDLPDDMALATATNWGASIADCEVYGDGQQQVMQQQLGGDSSGTSVASGLSRS